MEKITSSTWCIDLKADVKNYRAMSKLWNECIRLVPYDGKAQILVTYSVFHLSVERDKKTGLPVSKAYDRELKGNVERDEYQHGAGWHMHNLLWVEDAERGQELAERIVSTWQEVCKKHDKEWKRGETKARPWKDLGKVAYVLLQEVHMTTKSWGFKGKQDRQDFFRRATTLLRIEANNKSSFILWQDNLRRAWLDVSGGDLFYKLFVVGQETTGSYVRTRQLRRIEEIYRKRRYFSDLLRLKELNKLAAKVRKRLKRRGLEAFLAYAMSRQEK